MATKKADAVAVFRAAKNEILDLAERGVPLETAARSAGISRAHLREWISSGQAGQTPFAGFLRRIDQIQERFRRENERAVQAAAKMGKRGAQRWLERHTKTR